MSPERLSELRRQRALVSQHLEWLDREIAAAESPAPPPAAPAPLEISPMPAVILPEYVPDPEGARRATKRGCLLYAALALVLFFAVLLAIYFWRYRDRPLLFAPTSSLNVAPASDRQVGAGLGV